MPFRSRAQRRYLYARHPEVAREFEKATPKGRRLPEYVNPMNPPKPYLVDQVVGGLAVGPAPPSLPRQFHAVVFCAVEYQPDFGDPADKILIYAPFDDGMFTNTPPTKEEIHIAHVAAARVELLLRRRLRVLVTCRAGLNRSCLVAGLAMRKMGYSAIDTIARLRIARGEDALSNKYFEKIVRDYDGPSRA